MALRDEICNEYKKSFEDSHAEAERIYAPRSPQANLREPWKDINCLVTINQWDTSSTAQGGGGSFKNRKPIGEVGCCESGMAERSH